MAFKLRFPKGKIDYWAGRYAYPNESVLTDQIGPAARERGYLTREEFLALCEWKTPRSKPRCATNPESLVREATGLALASDEERLKVGILQLLAGVGWPTASVILHFCDRGMYPILDYRALWSLGARPPSAYTFDFWWAYTEYLRRVAVESKRSMRTIDRALWQYSKEKQADWSWGARSMPPGARPFEACAEAPSAAFVDSP